MTVFYLCPDHSSPSGGIRRIYRHVDILNGAGIEAAVVHSNPGFALHWFEHATAVRHAPLDLRPGDMLAIPEIFGDTLASLAPGIPRVSFNQNAYNTFHRVAEPGRHPYRESGDVIGVMTVSGDNYELLTYAFPGLPVARIRLGFAPGDFLFDDDRERVLAYLPRKRPNEIGDVLRLLEIRGVLEDWEAIPIANLSERQVRQVLARTVLFLSFSKREGFPLPPAEALASGCFVIGFTGFGGREYFDPRFTISIEDGDVVSFAKTAEDWMRSFHWGPGHRRRAAEGARFIFENYPATRETEDVTNFFTGALDVASRRPPRHAVLPRIEFEQGPTV